jgi:hypothetical protein
VTLNASAGQRLFVSQAALGLGGNSHKPTLSNRRFLLIRPDEVLTSAVSHKEREALRTSNFIGPDQ